MAPSSVRVGIGDAEIGQNGRFEPFHDRRIGLMEMIIAEKVEEAMDDQMGKMALEGQGPGFRSSFNGFPSDNDIAEEGPETAGFSPEAFPAGRSIWVTSPVMTAFEP